MTLRANELRIRNFVTIHNIDAWPEMRDVPVIVTAVKGHMDEDEMRMFPNSRGEVHVLHGNDLYSQFDEFIKPITLTEEWLIRFGFEKNELGNYDKRLELAFVDGHYHFHQGWTNVKLIYVHQLQNLYFSLTGEELIL